MFLVVEMGKVSEVLLGDTQVAVPSDRAEHFTRDLIKRVFNPNLLFQVEH